MQFRINYNYCGLVIFSFLINFAFTFQLSNLTLTLKLAGASESSIPVIWLIPPLTGLFIQPLIGYFSDNSRSHFGRRKPYILGWSMAGALAFFVLSQNIALTTIIFFTFLVNCSLNGCAESLRSLIADTFVQEDVRTRAFSIFAFWAGLGGYIGSLLPNIMQKILVFSYISPDWSLKYSYIFTGIIILLCSLYFLFYREKKPVKAYKNFQVNVKNMFTNFKKVLQTCSNYFYKILGIHSLSWFGIFIFWLYFSMFLEQNFYPDNLLDKTEKLQKISLDVSWYFSIYQYVSLLFTLGVFWFFKKINVELVHTLAVLIGGIGFFLLGTCIDIVPISIPLGMIGIFWGSLIVLPYVIIMKYFPQAYVGAFLGIFNISITLPQIIGGCSLSFIYELSSNNTNFLFIIAGIIVTISGVLWLKIYINHRKILMVHSVE